MINKLTLPNGVRIVSEELDYLHSATCGIWVKCGSRIETKKESGYSHFIEHMLFKGTETRSGSELSSLFDMLGGNSNAYTTKEMTAYYAKTLSSKITDAGELLCDMLFKPLFDGKDIESERKVIFEEIGMYEDDPEDLATEKLCEEVYRGSPLGMPILGSKEALKKADSDALRKYMKEYYTGENVVIALSGRLGSEAVDYFADRFSSLPRGSKNEYQKAEYKPSLYIKKKKFEQNHFCLLFPAFSCHEEKRFKLSLLSGIVGGGMSSRLFRIMREENGLCYSVYSFVQATAGEGLFGIYTATGKENEEKAITRLLEELRRIKDDGIKEEELFLIKEKLKADVLMNLESTGARASYMAKNELIYDEIPPYDGIIKKYDSITADDLTELAREILDFNRLSFSAVGRVGDAESYERYGIVI